MMVRRRGCAAALIVVVLPATAGCTPQERGAAPLSRDVAQDTGTRGAVGAAVTTRPAACNAEADLLAQPVAVFAAPQPGARLVAELEPGWAVYRCERSGAWLGVMFPRVGERADCSYRQTGGGGAPAPCPTGWVHGDITSEILG